MPARGYIQTPEHRAAISAALIGANKKHGHSWPRETSTYKSWRSMIQRCTNPNRADYIHYYGRGITVCDRWRVFENFLADMGERPEGKTLDRIDNDGNYEPGNCRWATASEQEQNKRRRQDAQEIAA